MDFSLTEEQKMLQTMVHDFAEKEIEPIAARIDEDSCVPTECLKKLFALGVAGVLFPEEYGGSSGGKVEQVIIDEELARVSASVDAIFLVTAGLAGYPLYRFGNEDQRQRFVPPVARGEKLACFALTEPSAGSDVAALQTIARRKNGGYVLNGNKVFITNGGEADIAVVFATVDRSLRHKGITAFIVEKGTPGFTAGKHERKLGIRGSSTAELVFEDCYVPEENRLGEEGEGFKIAMTAIDGSRVSIAAQGVGIAQGAFEKAFAYSREREQFGQPICNFEAVQWFLTDMATMIDSARLLTYRAAYLQDQKQSFIKEASMAKVYAAEAAMFVTTKALQVHGGYGYTRDYPLERYFRDARILEIYEGTSEMQRMTIARHLLRED